MMGIAPDGGLFMPANIPPLPKSFFASFYSMTFQEVAYAVSDALFDKQLKTHEMINHALNFPVPLVGLSETLYVLELFHGPSLAFKDFGARFMAQLMSFFNREEKNPLQVLVATSGDTGGAVASGFYNVPGINVLILFPKGKVSPLQELQLTTFGNNVRALEVEGTFDQCQDMVKNAFSDPDLKSRFRLTSANSINIARLIPQMFYYFEALRSLGPTDLPITVAVPSGNFGNLTAGLFAKKMGLPIDRFIAATNINDVVPSYLKNGLYKPRRSMETISNAMDVGKPSNFIRMLDLYGSTWNDMKKHIVGKSYKDQETLQSMKHCFDQFGYTLDPHGAVAYRALLDHQQLFSSVGIFLETAHPSKFKSVVDQAINIDLPLHKSLESLKTKPAHKSTIDANYLSLKSFLLDSPTP